MFDPESLIMFENPRYGLIGMAIGGVLVVLLYLSLRRLRRAEKRLEPVKWRTMRKAFQAMNVGVKVGVVVALASLLATPYIPTRIEIPVEEATEEQMKSYAVTVMLLMDVSKSMESSDLKPTRLQVSKSMAKLLVDRMGPKDLVGFVSFAGEIQESMPPTTDRSSVVTLIDNQTFHPSTAIGTALQAAIGVLEAFKGGRAIVLLSDGKNNWGANLTVAVDSAVTVEIPIFTVFVGAYGVEADPLSLREMADKTGGKFYEVRNEDVNALAAEVSEISREVKIGALKKVQTEIAVEARNYETPTAILSTFLLVSLFLTWLTGV